MKQEEKKPRIFWLANPDLDFDLNWKKIHAAEYPHKDTLEDSLKVIEYSAYEALKAKLEKAKDALRFYVMDSENSIVALAALKEIEE